MRCRIIGGALSAIVMLSAVAMVTGDYSTSSVSGLNGQEFQYRYIENGTAVEIFNWLGQGTDFVVPDLIDGKPVTSIGIFTFHGSPYLINVTVPDSVKNIGDYAFSACPSLNKVALGSGIKRIGDHSFMDCKALSSITMPEGVTRIGNESFKSCSNLTSISIPANVTTIGECAFTLCTNLSEILVESGNTKYASIEGVLFDKDITTLIACPALKKGSYEVPDGVIRIEINAFQRCVNLNSVVLPEGVIGIGSHSFSDCYELASINIPSTIERIDGYAFSDCWSLTSLVIPGNISTIQSGSFWGCTALTSIDIPASVYFISDRAFMNCTSLRAVTIPSEVIGIDAFAFTSCTDLTTITFKGDAPYTKIFWTSLTDNNLVVYYQPGAKGFSTPMWNGLPTFPTTVSNTTQICSVTTGDGQATLSWATPRNVGDSQIDHYTIFMDTNPIRQTNETTTTVYGLTNGQTYSFKIVAHGFDGYETTAEVSVTPIRNEAGTWLTVLVLFDAAIAAMIISYLLVKRMRQERNQ